MEHIKNEIIEVYNDTESIFRELKCLANLIQSVDKVESLHNIGALIERMSDSGLENIKKINIINGNHFL